MKVKTSKAARLKRDNNAARSDTGNAVVEGGAITGASVGERVGETVGEREGESVGDVVGLNVGTHDF